MKKTLLSLAFVLAACGGAENAAPTTPAAPPAPSASTPPAPPPAPTGEVKAAEQAKPEPPKAEGPKPEDTSSLPAYIKAAVEAADRDDDDKKLDAGRKPGTMLQFCGVPEGGKVAEIASGGGYTAELLARAVGAKGKVYGVNSKWVLE
jgi:hypothetical protein